MTEPTAGEPTYTLRVLMVDDQPLLGEAVRRALADQADIEFHYCADSAESVRVAERIRPTVILQDLVMPGVDGLTLVGLYRSNPLLADVPVVMLSSKEDPAVKSQAFAAGAADYIVKLPDAIELVARIRHHSRAYLNQLQRDSAYRALHATQEQLLASNRELQRMTTVDSLTGLSNKRFFNEYLEAEWRRGLRDHQDLSVLMIDIDDFKRYNDQYGHLAGDEVLRAVGGGLQRGCLRSTDLVARFGGEEFVVLLPATPHAGARVVGERLRRLISALALAHEASTVADHVTISIGVATRMPRGDERALELVGFADGALYDAKRLGKNRVAAAATAALEVAPEPEPRDGGRRVTRRSR